VKIVVPTADYPPIEGGISTVTRELSRELAAMGHDVTVIAPHFPGMDTFDRGETPVRVVRYRGYHLGPLRAVPLMRKTRQTIVSSGADLLLAINPSSGGFAGIRAHRKYGTPFVTFAYAYEFLKFARDSFPARLLKSVYAAAQSVVAISHFTQDRLIEFGVAADRVRVVFPGAAPVGPVSPERLDDVRRRYVVDTPRMILSVGRLINRKGQLDLVRAMPRVLEQFPDALLMLAGRGPMMKDILRAAHVLGVREQVCCPGMVPGDDLAALYQLCALFALPAGEGGGGHVEGFGLVYSEAHAFGKPAIAGRAGGAPDAVLDGETGLLVTPGDVDGIADALIRLLGDPEYAKVLGENGRRRVERELNWRRFAEGVLEAAQ
jgi:phosphatidylinositol alpha-1,6-mannosyltransferase